MNRVLKLNNGRDIPVIGLGTYKSDANELRQAVIDAIDAGYRHFDCAWFYKNEDIIGEALHEKLKEGKIKRDDLFITSKLWNNFHAKHLVVPMIKDSLSKLKLDYLDLYLIHWPMGFKEDTPLDALSDLKAPFTDVDYLETWDGMEECVKLGLTKSIGLSNFNSQQIDRVLKHCTIKPVVNQIEVNPNINQKKMIEFCRERQIIVVGFTPLGRSSYVGKPGFPTPTIQDPKVLEMGRKYNKTPAQIILNYLVSLGISVIPKSVTKSRIIENYNVFDFELNQEDITYLDSLSTGQRVSSASNFVDHKYYPFNIEF